VYFKLNLFLFIGADYDMPASSVGFPPHIDPSNFMRGMDASVTSGDQTGNVLGKLYLFNSAFYSFIIELDMLFFLLFILNLFVVFSFFRS
jgi:hypothetical protein